MILRRIWGQRALDWTSWAIQKDPNEIERQLWKKREVDVFDVPLDEYISSLDSAFPDPPAEGVGM